MNLGKYVFRIGFFFIITKFYKKLISCLGTGWKIKLTLIIEISNLIQLLVSTISHYSQRLSGIFIEKTTFEEFVEICEQIHRK